MLTMLILAADLVGDELQTLVSKEEFEDAGSKIEDFFVSGTRDHRILGVIEVTGDVEHLSGAYIKEM